MRNHSWTEQDNPGVFLFWADSLGVLPSHGSVSSALKNMLVLHHISLSSHHTCVHLHVQKTGDPVAVYTSLYVKYKSLQVHIYIPSDVGASVLSLPCSLKLRAAADMNCMIMWSVQD